MFVVLIVLMLQYIKLPLVTAKVGLLNCPVDSFTLEGMNGCHSHLSCKDWSNIEVVKLLGMGAVKKVFLVNWKNFSLAMSMPINKYHLEDFLNGVQVLKLLNPSKHIVQFLGYCKENYSVLTEFHPNGNAADYFVQELSNISLFRSLHFCYQYANILTHLHHSSAGRRVFCDSNSLQKLLSQLLVSNDLTLVLNDVDAVPKVENDNGIKCGHRQLVGKFVAPEQLWTAKEEFKDNMMPGYDEKTDIWKAATVCEYFLSLSKQADVLKYRLFDVHAKCKSYNPSMRPTSKELEIEYRTVLEEFKTHTEL